MDHDAVGVLETFCEGSSCWGLWLAVGTDLSDVGRGFVRISLHEDGIMVGFGIKMPWFGNRVTAPGTRCSWLGGIARHVSAVSSGNLPGTVCHRQGSSKSWKAKEFA